MKFKVGDIVRVNDGSVGVVNYVDHNLLDRVPYRIICGGDVSWESEDSLSLVLENEPPFMAKVWDEGDAGMCDGLVLLANDGKGKCLVITGDQIDRYNHGEGYTASSWNHYMRMDDYRNSSIEEEIEGLKGKIKELEHKLKTE